LAVTSAASHVAGTSSPVGARSANAGDYYAVSTDPSDARRGVPVERPEQVQQSPPPPPHACPTCDEPIDRDEPTWCRNCVRPFCPFCGTTGDCDHLAGFSRDTDWAISSLDDIITDLETLQSLGYDYTSILLDDLAEGSSRPITTVQFEYSGWTFTYHYAMDGHPVQADFERRVRQMIEDAKDGEQD
jgi:hypothetical protein